MGLVSYKIHMSFAMLLVIGPGICGPFLVGPQAISTCPNFGQHLQMSRSAIPLHRAVSTRSNVLTVADAGHGPHAEHRHGQPAARARSPCRAARASRSVDALKNQPSAFASPVKASY
jgi:hypothetical protein